VNVTRLAVIGGGISGLAAAWEAISGDPSWSVTLIESSPRLGGKIATEEFAGIEVDMGPDSFLARVPAAAQLAREVGLGDELVAPATGQAWLWARHRLRALPTGLVLGVPADVAALARSSVLPRSAAARAALDLVLPGRPVGAGEDIAIGELIRRRMGSTVQLGLVDPLLGGINAGHTDRLSAAVVAPQLLAAARRDRSLLRGLRAAGTSGTASGAVTSTTGAAAPVFLTVRGGLQRLVEALGRQIAASPGSEVITGEAAVGLERGVDNGWSVRLTGGRSVECAAVVMACPPAAAAPLLAPLSPPAATSLRLITTSSVALTLLAYPETTLPAPLVGSGFLVPRTERRVLTAASWLGPKWPHLATPGRVLIRASAGRVDDGRALAMDDDQLTDRVHMELASAMGLRRKPLEVRVHRWPDAFPQFAVGHLDMVAGLEARISRDAPGVALAGAALRGVGIAACITGGRAATARLRDGE